MKAVLGLILALASMPANAADISNIVTLPDGSLVIALPPCLPGYMATGPYCVLGASPVVPPVATLIEPTPLSHGTFTLTGTISPVSPPMVVKIDWYNGATAPPATEPIVTCVTDPTGASFSCSREVIDNPGQPGKMWMQVNGGPWQVVWSGTPA